MRGCSGDRQQGRDSGLHPVPAPKALSAHLGLPFLLAREPRKLNWGSTHTLTHLPVLPKDRISRLWVTSSPPHTRSPGEQEKLKRSARKIIVGLKDLIIAK